MCRLRAMPHSRGKKCRQKTLDPVPDPDADPNPDAESDPDAEPDPDADKVSYCKYVPTLRYAA
jgi:hypothetical protein